MYTLIANAMWAMNSPEAESSGGSFVAIFAFLYALCVLIAGWRVFSKADEPGWASLIPIYNVYVLLRIVGRPIWWLVLMLIPGINFIVGVVLALDVAKSYGKGFLYGLGLAFLTAPFTLHLGLGDSRYTGPAAA